MKQAENIKVDSSKRAKENGIAFLIASSLFALYWALFLVFGKGESSQNALHIFFVVLELVFSSLIAVVSSFSLRKKNHERYELFFTINWVLLTLATFPLPFAYLSNASISNGVNDNEIASMTTPTTILCVLALFFAAASYEKYIEMDITAHKVFIRLMVGCLFASAIYVFGSLLYKIWANVNPAGLFNTVYFYIALAIIYLSLCIYSSYSVGKEMSLPSIDAKREAPDKSKSLFHLATVFYLCYSLLKIISDCYNLASAFSNTTSTLSIPFGYVDAPTLLGDQVFLFLIHTLMLVYSFILLHEKDERRNPLFSLNLLSALFSISYFVPSFMGVYGLIVQYSTSRVRLVHPITSIFAILTFSAIGAGSSIAGLLYSDKRSIDSALFLSVASCMMVGVSIAAIYGVIALLIAEKASWPLVIITLLERLEDVAVVTVSLLALTREYPSKKKTPAA